MTKQINSRTMTNNIVCFQFTLKLFRIYQIFPMVGKEQNPGKIFFLKFALTCFLASGLMVGSFMHCFYSLHVRKSFYIFKDISYALSMLGGFSFIILFALNSASATKLFTFLSDFKNFGKPPKFEKRNEELNNLSKYHYIYISLATFSFLSATNIFTPAQCKIENEEYDMKEVCGLVTNAWFPFDIDFFPVKQIYTILQLFSILYVCVTAGTVTWLIVEIVQHFSVRIDHIKILFREALNQEHPVKMKRDFRFAAKYHSTFLQLGNEFNDCFSIAMLFMMLLGAAILGSAAFGSMQGRSSSLLLVCLSWFVGLAMVCTAGQHLMNESLSIGEAIYHTKWYHCDPSLRKDIIIVLARCQRPMTLKAAGFGVMDHTMIVSVLRTSYSFINLLGAVA